MGLPSGISLALGGLAVSRRLRPSYAKDWSESNKLLDACFVLAELLNALDPGDIPLAAA